MKENIKNAENHLEKLGKQVEKIENHSIRQETQLTRKEQGSILPKFVIDLSPEEYHFREDVIPFLSALEAGLADLKFKMVFTNPLKAKNSNDYLKSETKGSIIYFPKFYHENNHEILWKNDLGFQTYIFEERSEKGELKLNFGIYALPGITIKIESGINGKYKTLSYTGEQQKKSKKFNFFLFRIPVPRENFDRLLVTYKVSAQSQ